MLPTPATNDRHEAREDDGLAAVALVELVRALQIRGIDPAAEKPQAGPAPDPIVGIVSAERSGDERGDDREKVHLPQRGQRPRDEEERIAREERRDHEAGLAEHDDEEESVHPHAVKLHELTQMDVEVNHEIPQEGEKLHRPIV
jgi:hypothetical protein